MLKLEAKERKTVGMDCTKLLFFFVYNAITKNILNNMNNMY